MVKGDYEYRIIRLPINTTPFKAGYRFGAFKRNMISQQDVHITEYFETEEEVWEFVNNNPEYKIR